MNYSAVINAFEMQGTRPLRANDWTMYPQMLSRTQRLQDLFSWENEKYITLNQCHILCTFCGIKQAENMYWKKSNRNVIQKIQVQNLFGNIVSIISLEITDPKLFFLQSN